MNRRILFYAVIGACVSIILSANNFEMRPGAPIGVKNPGQTCWLNATLTMLFSTNTPLLNFMSLHAPSEPDKSTLFNELYKLVADMHNADTTAIAYKNEMGVYGQFWKALGKEIPGLSYDQTSSDIDAFNAITRAVNAAAPEFSTQFGAEAFAKILDPKHNKFGQHYFSAFIFDPTNPKIDIDQIFTDLTFKQNTKHGVIPLLLWIKCEAEQQQPVMFNQIIALTKWLSHPTYYQLNGATLYRIYQSTLPSGKLSENKIHYASIVLDDQTKPETWYLIDDATIKKLSSQDIKDLATNGKWNETWVGANKTKFTKTWYPSILQYSFWKIAK